MNRRRWIIATLLLAAAAYWSARALALINPDFTPLHLVNQADQLLLLEVGPVSPAGEVPANFVRAIKGDPLSKAPLLDLRQMDAVRADELRKSVGDQKRPALLCVVKLSAEKNNPAASASLLHVGTRWYRLTRRAPLVWQVDRPDDTLQGTWSGATDMLVKAVEYALSDAKANFPAKADAAWGVKQRVGKLEGRVFGAMSVELAAGSPLCLFVMCESGDRLYQCEAGQTTPREIATERNLGSKSRVAAWGYFNDDTRLDLASVRGDDLEIWAQSADGTFRNESRMTLPGDCRGLMAVESGVAGRSAILIDHAGRPRLLETIRGDIREVTDGGVGGGEHAKPQAAGGRLGVAGPFLVADFDGDRQVDLVQSFAAGGLFYKGMSAGHVGVPPLGGGASAPAKAGTPTVTGWGGSHAQTGGPPAVRVQFAAPIVIEGVANAMTANAAAPTAGFTGDYDADGLLDVLLTGETGCRLWVNLGDGRFKEAFHEAGEPATLAKPRTIGGGTCDINNDGRQDFLVAYADRAPQVFFNRGFRSFGLAATLALEEEPLLPKGAAGQQDAVVADFNADSAQDLAIVTGSGELLMLFRDPAKGANRALQISLNAGQTGPLNVTAFDGSRSLGTQVLSAGRPALIGKLEKGPLTLKWQVPGYALQSQQVIVLRSRRFEVPY